MRIAIFASVGAQNLGDELILKNEIAAIEAGKVFPVPMVKTFSKKKQNALFEFRVFTYDKFSHFFTAENVKYIEYFPTGIKTFNNILRNIQNCYKFIATVLWANFIIVGGGGLFYDSELQASQNNLVLWKRRSRVFRFFSKKVIFYGISVDIKNIANKKNLQNIFEGAFRVFVRDEASKLFLQDIGVNSKEMWDPVFFDNGDEFPKKSGAVKTVDSKAFSLKDIEGIDFKGKKIGIALRQGYFSESNEEAFVQKLLEEILSAGAEKIILLPMSFHPSDFQANDYYFLKNFIKGEKIVMGGDNMQEIYENFKNKKIDVCFAMRLHSIILSQVYQIPYIGISYSKKTDEILKKLSS